MMNVRVSNPRRYALVRDDRAGSRLEPGQIRRYSLARLAPASRSALGEVAQRGSDGAMIR
jgi:hypothetical protein